jgi:signal transduction histidine kinase
MTSALEATPRVQSFVLALSDALQPIGDPVEVQRVATRMLGEALGANRVLYAELEHGRKVICHPEYIDGLPSMAGTYEWDTFLNAGVLESLRDGRVFAMNDVDTDPNVGESAAAIRAVGMRAGLACMLQKDGRYVAIFGAQSATPRVWTEEEKALFSVVAERTWSAFERACAQAALRASEEKYHSLFDSIDEGVCLVELLVDGQGQPSDFRFLETNPAFERLTGALGVVGKTTEPMAVERDLRWFDLLASVWRTGKARRLLHQSSVGERWWDVYVAPVGARERRRLACVFNDVTASKTAAAALQRALEREQAARAAAEAAAQLRDDFVGVVSHELRTPLSALLVWSKVLRDGALDDVARARALEAIATSAEMQRQLVDQLLDTSRLTAGKAQLAMRDAPLAPVVESALSVLRATAEARQITLVDDLGGEPMSTSGGASLRALVDADRLRQVLCNVIGNAVKFTPPGGRVEVRLRAEGDAAVVEVRDTGVGIAPEFLPFVFDRFRQADPTRTRRHGGLGLGLSIARQLIELHGGLITAASDGVGRGALFRIELPLGAADGAHAREVHASAPFVPQPLLRGRRILLVEDDAHTRAALTWLLEQCAASVVAVAEASSVREALGHGATFDALVCDIGLPDEDGCDLLRSVRALPNGTLPAVALTAYVRRKDRARAEAAGFDAFVAKPVDPDTIVETVVGLLA